MSFVFRCAGLMAHCSVWLCCSAVFVASVLTAHAAKQASYSLTLGYKFVPEIPLTFSSSFLSDSQTLVCGMQLHEKHSIDGFYGRGRPDRHVSCVLEQGSAARHTADRHERERRRPPSAARRTRLAQSLRDRERQVLGCRQSLLWHDHAARPHVCRQHRAADLRQRVPLLCAIHRHHHQHHSDILAVCSSEHVLFCSDFCAHTIAVFHVEQEKRSDGT